MTTDDLALRNVTDMHYVVFDFETVTAAGFAPEPVELGALRVNGGLTIDGASEVSWLIRPPAEIPLSAASAAAMGLRLDDLLNKPSAEIAIGEFESLFGSDPHVMVAHNASYDISCLKRYQAYCQKVLMRPFLDTVRLAKHLLPNLHSYRLDTLAMHFDLPIPVDRHRSLPDVRLTSRIFMRLFENWQRTRQDHRFYVLQRTAGVNSGAAPIQSSLFD